MVERIWQNVEDDKFFLCAHLQVMHVASLRDARPDDTFSGRNFLQDVKKKAELVFGGGLSLASCVFPAVRSLGASISFLGFFFAGFFLIISFLF